MCVGVEFWIRSEIGCLLFLEFLSTLGIQPFGWFHEFCEL